MSILEQIVERTKQRIKPDDTVIRQASAMPKGNFPFEKSLKGEEMAFICEVKKASPSKGIICEDFDYIGIAENYEKTGAAAISVLTEPYWFMGRDDYLREIAGRVNTPLLRKDFTVDEYMIYEAKVLGASAVLFICAILDLPTLERYIKIADSLGLSALVETHNADEIGMALAAGARLVGVNNRNLATFEVDITLSEKLRPLVPDDVIFVAESGIKTREDIKRLKAAGVNAVLIGEALMKGAKLL
jgi:indole-3-glycerol phosphate synthase